jgi:hypothetical protein
VNGARVSFTTKDTKNTKEQQSFFSKSANWFYLCVQCFVSLVSLVVRDSPAV